MKLGQFKIQSFVEHKFSLDGGAMFGVIPRVMWEKLIPPDEKNMIPMVNNVFLLKAHGKNILFETGLGSTLSDREKIVYNADGNSSLESGLASLGIKMEQIDSVILTHLHTDHAGGAVKFENDKFVPAFPNATYFISQKEWEVATNPNERTSAVYVPERYLALKDSGQVEFIDGDGELFPGISTVHTGGHTEGHFGIEIESEGERLFYYADIFPTSAHMRVPFIPATDLFPLDSMDIKRKKLAEIIADNVIMAFDHDVEIPFARIKQDGKKILVESAENEVVQSRN